MYNEEQKKRFMAERNAEAILSPNFLKQIFTATEPFEKNLEKDICQFTTSEIMDFYKVMNIKSIDRIMNIHSQLNHYGYWCMKQNLITDGINHFAELNTDILISCVNVFAMQESLMTRDQVLDVINQFKNFRDKFVILMLFETGKSKDLSNIFRVKYEDFKDGHCNLPDGRKVRISEELFHVTMECKSEDIYQTYVINPYRQWHAERELSESEYVYKEVKNVKLTDNANQKIRLAVQMKKIFEYVGLPYSTKINSFVESGITWDFKCKAYEEGVTVEELAYNKLLRQDIEYQHNIIITPKTFLRKYGRYLE